jgi:serine O-acetyltransferase
VQAGVPDGARMLGMRARPLGARPNEPVSEPVFQPYGIGEDIPDPVARALNGLLDEVTSLKARIAVLERPSATPASDEERPRLGIGASGNGAEDD